MRNPDANSSYSDNPYGAYTQQNQNWERQRQEAVAQKNREWEAAQYREQERERQRQEERRRQQAQAARSNATRRQTTSSPSRKTTSAAKSKSSSSDGNALKDIFTFIGFLIGAIGTYQQSDDNLVAAIIVGLITGAIGRATYKFIIAIGVIAFVLYLFYVNQ